MNIVFSVYINVSKTNIQLIHLGINFPRVIQKYTIIVLILQYFATKLYNFTKYNSMLFEAMIKYLPSSNYFKIPPKR